MFYLLLIFIIMNNTYQAIAFKNTKERDSFNVIFGVTLWSLLFTIPVLIIFLAVKGTAIFSSVGWMELGFIAFLAVLSIISIVFWIKTVQNMSMSTAEGVSNIYIAFLTLFSWLIFGGRLTFWQIFLVGIIIVVCIILSLFQRKHESMVKRYKYGLGISFLLMWMALAVIRGLIPGEIAQAGMHGIIYSFLLHVFMLIFTIGILLFRKQSFNTVIKSSLKDHWMSGIGFCRMIEQAAIVYLATRINLGIIDAIGVLSLVLIVLYERFVMKEHLNKYSYIFLAIITIATFLLMLI